MALFSRIRPEQMARFRNRALCLLLFVLSLAAVQAQTPSASPAASASVAPTQAPPALNLYWAPPNVTKGGQDIDFILNVIFGLTTVVFILVQGVYTYYLVKYRRKPGSKAYYSHGNNSLEFLWTTTPTVIFLGLAIWSNTVWYKLHAPAPENSLAVEIVGYQFAWDIRYGGADGVLAKGDDLKFTLENKFGVDPADPAGKDDFTSTELVIPVNRPIHVYLRARDVIHSFYVPAFRLYQDAVPGRTITWMWFECTQTGNFELACSQLCGEGHYNMKAKIRVVSQEEFQKWLDGKIQQTAAAAAPTADATTQPTDDLTATPALAHATP